MDKSSDKDLILANGATQIVSASQLDGMTITADVIKSDQFAKSYNNLATLAEYFSAVKKAIDDEVKEVIQQDYVETGEASINIDGYTFTYNSPSSRENFQTKKFKEERPDLYKQYVSVSSVAGSLKVYKSKKKDDISEDDEAIEADFKEIK